ncbi:MAG: hypothetical protein IT364_15915 [Candidatus Hydrogenedentes bacterium]|nr:hypothetical protein [Candidatus Hydrogenedentota bacterium]
MLKSLRLEIRTVLQISAVAIIGVAVMVGFVSMRARSEMRTEAYDKTREIALHNGQRIATELTDALSAARALGKVFESAASRRESIDRQMFLNTLVKVVEARAFYFGAWVQFEPDMFDGKDAQFAGGTEYGVEGSFMPYAKREGKTVSLVPSTGTYEEYMDEEYYKIPKETRMECIMTPYVEPDADNALMTSVCVPIIENDRVIGVAGIDVVLTEMSALVSEVRPFESGYAFLVANEGTFVGHPKAELAGENIKDFGATPEILEAIANGMEAHQMVPSALGGEASYAAYVPIRIGDTATPWSFAVVAPIDKVLAKAHGIMWATILIGAGMLLVLLSAVYVVVRAIARPLHVAVATLSNGSRQVDGAADQIAESSQSLALGASEQASSLEETSASLEEMASMTHQNADNAAQANGLMNEAKKIVAGGSEAVKQLSSAIAEIKQSADETAKIVQSIDGIAFQTNLLALNAAVEAARAGDAGKGFAVVAQEVRNLAQRSAEAARSTAALIELSQKNANNGVSVGLKVTESFALIQESASSVAGLISEIAAASKEHSMGIEQINTAVAQIDQITQANAANSEETASASQVLSSEARQLAGIASGLLQLVGGQTSQPENGRLHHGHAHKGTPPSPTTRLLTAGNATGKSPHNGCTKPISADRRRKDRSDHALHLDSNDLADF